MPQPRSVLPALILALACSAGGGDATHREEARGEVGTVDTEGAERATQMLAFADEATAARDSATAREYLAEAARLDSTDAGLQLRLARADDALGNARFALTEYRRFLALSSQRSSAAARAAAASRSSGRPPSKPSSRRTASR